MRSLPIIFAPTITIWSFIGLGISIYAKHYDWALGFCLMFIAFGFITAIQIVAKWPEEPSCKLKRNPEGCDVWIKEFGGCAGCPHSKLQKL